MPNATRIRSEQQTDLLQQLEKAGAPIAPTSSDSSDSLETLKSNCRLVEGIVGLVKTNDGDFCSMNSFGAAPPQRLQPA
jgi:hypothetical protein